MRVRSGFSIILLVSTCVAGPVVPVAFAQNGAPNNACESAVTREVRSQSPQADRVQFMPDGASETEISNAETGYNGQGQFNDRSSNWTSFSYSCVFNERTGQTYSVSVRNAGYPATQPARKSGGGGGAVAGALLGAILVGAVAAGASKHDRDQGGGGNRPWSPADGVQCYPRQSACYSYGDFSAKWTRRIYG